MDMDMIKTMMGSMMRKYYVLDLLPVFNVYKTHILIWTVLFMSENKVSYVLCLIKSLMCLP